MIPVYKDLLSLIFPRECVGCNSIISVGQEWLCTNCLFDLPKVYSFSNSDNTVTKKLHNRFPFKYARSLFVFKKNNKVQDLLHLLKYYNSPLLAKFLGKKLGNILVSEKIFLDLDLIIPVPLHRGKQKLRGYNQSSYFGSGLSEVINTTFSDKYLFRVKNTETQTKKNRAERAENVSLAFDIRNIEELAGKHILLVDDVITTGATLEACAKTLLKTTNLKELSIATIAVAE